MTFEEIIEILFPYLYSIRRLKKYLSFDLIFPTTWEFSNQIVEKLQITQNEGNDGKLITSIVTLPNDMSGTLSSIQKIIYHNLEREEKEKLFKSKVSELKKLFGSTNLEQLKHLEFSVYDEEDGEPQLYGTDDDEGLEGNGEGA
jgi:transcriptional regulator of heat shock response